VQLLMHKRLQSALGPGLTCVLALPYRTRDRQAEQAQQEGTRPAQVQREGSRKLYRILDASGRRRNSDTYLSRYQSHTQQRLNFDSCSFPPHCCAAFPLSSLCASCAVLCARVGGQLLRSAKEQRRKTHGARLASGPLHVSLIPSLARSRPLCS